MLFTTLRVACMHVPGGLPGQGAPAFALMATTTNQSSKPLASVYSKVVWALFSGVSLWMLKMSVELVAKPQRWRSAPSGCAAPTDTPADCCWPAAEARRPARSRAVISVAASRE